MLKRYTAILLLIIASILLMGHNLIPHHHHSDYDVADHHHTNESHDGDEDGNVLSHMFSHVFHEAGTIGFFGNDGGPSVIKKALLLVAILLDSSLYREVDAPPLIPNPLAERHYYLSYCASAMALRGPPAFMA